MVGFSTPQQVPILAMAERLAHRGPDDFGLFLDQNSGVALAHRRLSIVDLSSNGRQPMTTRDGRWTITFNGEIYNHAALRGELHRLGYTFTSTSDTEVLLYGYQAWGEQVLDRAIGMFAFGIWDSHDRTLFLARDRVGKKPLVYFTHGNTLTFASELKALLAVPGFEPVLNPDAVDAFLALGYIPAPLTIFRGAQKLPPGHLLTWRDGKCNVRRYWQPETAVHSLAVKSDPIADFRQLFREAVRLRLQADVPVGLYLSGGIDSSAIAVECAALNQNIAALTVTFDADSTDLPHACTVAKQFGLQHEIVTATGRQLADDLTNIHWFYDEPFADSSSIPCYYIARQTQGRFKVILTGDGGDEALAGYPHYEFVAAKQLLKRSAAAVGLKDGSWRDPRSTYFQSRALFRQRARTELLRACPAHSGGFAGYLKNEPFLQTVPTGSLHRALWADRHVYLPNDLLYKMDIALMAHGIEGRSPFLDHRLLEWCQRLPAKQLVRYRSKKRLLRRAYRSDLPDEILDRRKHGFGAPVKHWLQGPLRDLLRDYLPTNLLDSAPQKRLHDSFSHKPSAQTAQQLWILLTFAVWAKKWNVRW
jgi:asparagine synthase (glutamine-hydrolysing)